MNYQGKRMVRQKKEALYRKVAADQQSGGMGPVGEEAAFPFRI